MDVWLVILRNFSEENAACLSLLLCLTTGKTSYGIIYLVRTQKFPKN